MIYRVILLYLVILCIDAKGQQFLPDSLKQKFSNLPQDSNYVDQLNKIAAQYLSSNPAVTRNISAETLNLAMRIKYLRGYARALSLTGNSYWYEGVYAFAQNYYLLAARQYKLLNDSIGLGKTYNNIGEVYKKLNDPDKAFSYLLRARLLLKNDKSSYPMALYNIGELFIQVNNTEAAKKYIDTSLDVAWKQGDVRVVAFNYGGLGAIQRKEKNFTKAFDFYTHAEKMWKELGERRSLIQTYQEISMLYREQQQYAKAEKYLLQAMTMAKKIKVPDLQIRNYLSFSQLDSIQGNYGRALHFLRLHNSLKDSVYDLLKAEQIARLQTIYETEAHQQENLQLRSEKKLRDAQLQSQRKILTAITCGLILAGILAWFLYRQRRKILLQKNAIEMQATVLMKLNEDLKELNKNLERRIAERTSQIIDQNKFLAEYIFINAHKLRGPVASVLGLINLLQQVPPHEKEDILIHLKTCGEQLDKIIHEVTRNLESAIIPEN